MSNVMRRALEGGVTQPFVMKGAALLWEVHAWGLEHIGDLMKDVMVEVKIEAVHATEESSAAFETHCRYLQVSMHDYIMWLTGDKRELPESPAQRLLFSFDRERFSMYLSYTHLGELLQDCPQVLDAWDKAVQWEDIGVSKHARDTTLWLGSRGCQTPTHFDSYGVNVVTQVLGRKVLMLIFTYA
jgi:HSPB1-associated protein 1